MTRWQAAAWLRDIMWEVTFDPERWRSERWRGVARDADRQVVVTVWASSEKRARRKLKRAVEGKRRAAEAVLASGSSGVMFPE